VMGPFQDPENAYGQKQFCGLLVHVYLYTGLNVLCEAFFDVNIKIISWRSVKKKM